MFAYLVLVATAVTMSASSPPAAPRAVPGTMIAQKQVSQPDLAPDESENLQAEIEGPTQSETPKEWKKRMVRPCTRVGNRVTC